MQLHSRHLENILRYWVVTEEEKQRKAQLEARSAALMAHQNFDDPLRVPEHCKEIRPKEI